MVHVEKIGSVVDSTRSRFFSPSPAAFSVSNRFQVSATLLLQTTMSTWWSNEGEDAHFSWRKQREKMYFTVYL